MNVETNESGEDSFRGESGQSSSTNSPAARWFAPTKQPLRTESGKHWNRSRREVLGAPADVNDSKDEDGKEDTKEEPNAVDVRTSSTNPDQRKSPTSQETLNNTAQNAASSRVTPLDQRARVSASVATATGPGENPMRRPSTAGPGENPMRRPSTGKDSSSTAQPAPTATQSPASVSAPASAPTAAPLAIKPPAELPSMVNPASTVTPTATSPPVVKPKSALSTSSKLSMSNLYEQPVSYKYLPLELASATTVKNSIAKNILFQSLGHGLLVIKYGRQGGPKKRVLYCDFGVTKLFWTDAVLNPETAHEVGIDTLIDPTRMVNLADVLEVRAGVDLDPETTTAALRTAAKAGVQEAAAMLRKRESSTGGSGGGADAHGGKEGKSEKRTSLVKSIFGGHHDKEGELLYGTAILRKKVKPEEFSKCLSLITADRSIDFQCFSKKDYNTLYINLKEIVHKLRNPTVLPPSAAPVLNEFKETLSTKKSVRFNFAEDSSTPAASPAVSSPPEPSRSFAQTETSSFASAGDVIHLDSDGNMDALLATAGHTPIKVNAPSGTPAKVKTFESPHRHRQRSVDSEDSDSGHNPATFSDETRELVRTMSSLSGLTGVSAAAVTDTTVSSGTLGEASHATGVTGNVTKYTEESASSKNPYRMRAHEALQIGLILAQQEQEFGTNMYQSLTPEDEPEIERLNSLGFSTEEAILKIFQKRFQPDLVEHEEEIVLSPDADFDYTDQFDTANSFKGSIKTIFGRQSSFFPQVFKPSDASETESKISNLTTESKSTKRREAAMAALDEETASVASPALSPAAPASQAVASPAPVRLAGPPTAPVAMAVAEKPDVPLTPPPSYEESVKITPSRPVPAAVPAAAELEEVMPAPPRMQSSGFSANNTVVSSLHSSSKSNSEFGSDKYPPPGQPVMMGSQSHRPSWEASPFGQDARRSEMMHRPQESPMTSPSRDDRRGSSSQPLLRMTSSDALQIGLLLSQQEAEFGVNMYDSLEDSDEGAIRRLVAQGYTNDEAVLEIFNRKFGKTGPRTKWSNVSPAAPVVNRLQPPPPPQPQYPPHYPPQYPPQDPGYPYQYGQPAPAYAPMPSQQSQYYPPAPQSPPYQQDYPPPMQPGPYGQPPLQRHELYPPDQHAQPTLYPQQSMHMGPNTPYDLRPAPINVAPDPRQTFHRTNSLAQSSFFPNDPHVMQPQYRTAPGGPPTDASNWRLNSALSPRSVSRTNMLTTLSDNEAMHMALLLSQQEHDFGVNMYDALRPQDEPELQSLIACGYTNEQAVLHLFERRYLPRNAAPAPAPAPAPQPAYSSSWDQSRLPDPRASQYIPSGGSYREPSPQTVPTAYGDPVVASAAPAPRPAPQRQASMVPPPGPARMASQYNIGGASNAPAATATPIVVTAVPLDESEHRAPRAPNSARGSGGDAPARTMHRQSSTATMGSSANAAPAAAPTPPRPQLAKKRSIFNFTTMRSNAADEIPPERKLKYKESDVKQLTNMGYSKEQAVWALLQSNNNLPMAIEALCRS